MTRPKLAFFTPLNPDRGGVTDHSEELLPELARFADIDIVTDQPSPPDTPSIVDNFRIIDSKTFLCARNDYDLPIYQLGNNFRQHGYMVNALLEVPGIIALQDYCLQYTILPLTVGAGDLRALEGLLRVDYGDRAHSLARRLLLGTLDPNSLSFAGALLRCSRGVIVHSRYLYDVVRHEHPSVSVRNVTMGVTIRDMRDKQPLRARYGYAKDDFILATLSTLVPKKRLLTLLEAINDLRHRYPRLRLLVVGGGSIGAAARGYIRDKGLSDLVRVTGWVPEQDYQDLTDLSDLVIDVRETSAGETANSLLRALAAGKPGIVSAAGVFIELPDDVCVKIDVDKGGKPALLNAIRGLIESPSAVDRLAASARTYALENLQLRQTADQYEAFIAELLSPPRAAPEPPAFELKRGAGLSASAIRLAYRVFRLGFLYRNYGFSDTVRRVRRELASPST